MKLIPLLIKMKKSLFEKKIKILRLKEKEDKTPFKTATKSEWVVVVDPT